MENFIISRGFPRKYSNFFKMAELNVCYWFWISSQNMRRTTLPFLVGLFFKMSVLNKTVHSPGLYQLNNEILWLNNSHVTTPASRSPKKHLRRTSYLIGYKVKLLDFMTKSIPLDILSRYFTFRRCYLVINILAV